MSVASSTSAATPASASAQSDSYTVVDPEDAKYVEDQPFIQTESGKGSFTISTPGLFVSFPEDTYEGNLGSKFEYKGKTIQELDRNKARFIVPVAMGGEIMDPALRAVADTLHKKQRLFFEKNYEAARTILENVFKKRPEAFLEHIEEAETAALNDVLTAAQDKVVGTDEAPEFESIDAIEAAAKTNLALRERIVAKALAKFIAGANMPPNPADYDEQGYEKQTRKSTASKKPKRIQLKLARKVWASKQGYQKGKDPAARAPVATLAAKSLDAWPAILEDAGENYKWQPFTYIDAKPGSATTGMEIQRPTYVHRATGKEMLDPSWSPFKDHMTLVQTSLMYQVYATPKPGVRIIPSASMFIVRDVPRARGGSSVVVDEMFASLPPPTASDGTASVDDGDEEPVVKRAKTTTDEEVSVN
jgi:hypothetical protein